MHLQLRVHGHKRFCSLCHDSSKIALCKRKLCKEQLLEYLAGKTAVFYLVRAALATSSAYAETQLVR